VSDPVTIRPASADDCEMIAGWLSRPDLTRWLGSQWRDSPVDPRRVAFALREKSNRFLVASVAGQPCGLVAISDLDMGDGVGMTWYLLGEDRRSGQGIMTRAVHEAVGWAFAELDLASLYAWVHPGNAASIRLLEKVGFQPAGRLRAAAVVNDQRVDRVLFDLTRADWKSKG
jgi:RimJ/RimL family protein N-acetyltransferase